MEAVDAELHQGVVRRQPERPENGDQQVDRDDGAADPAARMRKD